MIKVEHCVKKISGKLPNSYKRPGKMGIFPMESHPSSYFSEKGLFDILLTGIE